MIYGKLCAPECMEPAAPRWSLMYFTSLVEALRAQRTGGTLAPDDVHIR